MRYSEREKTKKQQFKLSIRGRSKQVRDWLKRINPIKTNRKHAIDDYNFLYGAENYAFFNDKNDSSLKSDYYVTPQFIITSDLISSADITKVKKGIRKLLLEQHSNKYFFTPDKMQEDIDKLRSYEPGAHFRTFIGYIDFNNVKKLKNVIENARVSIANLNDSYFILMLCVELSQEEQDKLQNLISSNYHRNIFNWVEHIGGTRWRKPKNKTGDELNELRKKRKPGGRTYVGRSFGDGTDKTKELDLEFDHIKYYIFKSLYNFFDLELMRREIVQPAFIIYKSNIKKFDDVTSCFLRSIGIPCGDGTYIPSLTQFITNNPDQGMVGFQHSSLESETNRYVLYFESKIQLNYENDTATHTVLENFMEMYSIFSRYDYKSFLYKEYRDTIVDYRDKIAQIKENGKSYGEVLKIRTKFYKEIDFYQSIDKIDRSYTGEVKMADQLPWIDQFKIVGICSFFNSRSVNRLNSYYQSVRREINEKADICKDLSDKHQLIKSNIVSLFALVVAALTLIVTLYSTEIRQLIEAIQHIVH